MLAIFGGPRPAFCVDVNPRKSSDAVGDQERAGHLRGDRHLLRQPLPAVEPATREALADARHVEDVEVGRSPSSRRRCGRGGRRAAARRRRSPRGSSRPGRSGTAASRAAPAPACPSSSSRADRRDVRVGEPRNEAAEVRQPPGDRDAEAGRASARTVRRARRAPPRASAARARAPLRSPPPSGAP